MDSELWTLDFFSRFLNEKKEKIQLFLKKENEMKIKNFKTFKKIASAEVFFNVFSCIKSRYIYAKEKKFILGETRSVRRILLFMPSNERQSVIHRA